MTKKNTKKSSALKKFLDSLPNSVSKMKAVKSAAELAEEVETQVKCLGKDASKEISRFGKKVKTSLKDIESLVNTVGVEASKQAQRGVGDIVDKYNSSEVKSEVEKRVNKVLSYVGLQRRDGKGATPATKAKPAKATRKARAARKPKAAANKKAKAAAQSAK